MTDFVTLVSRAQTGDVAAYGTLVERFRRMAVGYAESRLGDFHLAEDAAQDAFVHAYLSLGQLREAEAFPGWLRQIVSTYCNRLLRRSTHRVVLPDDEIAISGDQEEAMHRRDLRQRLRRAMTGLPEAERVVTQLFYFENLSQKDIASFLELPLTTVKYRLYTARQRLKPSLEGELTDMVKQTTRKDRPGLAARVQELLEDLHALHDKLAIRLQVVLTDALQRDVTVRVGGVEQTTAARFVSQLSNPCCTYTFEMTHLRHRAILDISLDLACAIAGHDSPGPMTLAEYNLVVPTLAQVYKDLDATWEGVGPIRASEIELETHPDFVLGEEASQDMVVHVALAVSAGNLDSAIHMAYHTSDLERLRPYLREGAQATAQDLKLPTEPEPEAVDDPGGVTLEPVTTDTSNVMFNMIPLHHHDEAGFGTWWSEPNQHGVIHSLPSTTDLRTSSGMFLDRWLERPEVFRAQLIRVEGRAIGFAMVEAPPVAPEGVEYYLSAFFLHHAHRDVETQDRALRLLFDSWRGDWEAATHPADHELQATLHRTLSDYTGGRYRSGLGVSSIHGTGMMAFRFNNSAEQELTGEA